MGAEYMGVSILVLGFVCFVNTRVSNHGITSVRPQAVEVQRQEPETEQQPQVGSMGWCQTPALVLYTPEQLRASETATSRFLDEFPQVLAATVSKFNLPGPKGQTIWDELRELRDPGCFAQDGKEDSLGTNDRHSFALWKPNIPCLSRLQAVNRGEGWTSMTMSG